MKHIDGNEIMEDGDVLHIPLLMLDAVQASIALHKPGPAPRNAERETRVEIAYEEAEQVLSHQWANGKTPPPPINRSNNVEGAYSAYASRISNAWRENK